MAKMEDGLTSWALAQSLLPCAGLPLRSSPSRHTAQHGLQIPAMSPQHHTQDPATTNPPRHNTQDPTANLPPRCLNMMQGPVTADPPRHPNTARKTPPLPTSLHATPIQMQGPVTADPPHRPNTAHKTHCHAAPTQRARPVVTPPQHGYKAPSPPACHAAPTWRARPRRCQPVITLPRHGRKTHCRLATLTCHAPQHGAQLC
ncbi:hypothetical protein EDB83DRAFT_2321420 [Lactarius deliciosus]|nr:hypothetical protein EDB83DRAFT_2321420 [Lactarius deliciosus]